MRLPKRIVQKKLPQVSTNTNDSPQDYPDFTWVGTIQNAHGILGEVKVYPQTENLEHYLGLDELWIETQQGCVAHQLKRGRIHKNRWIFQFSTIVTRNQAEELKGCRVLVADELLPPLEEDEYFYHELIGCQVIEQGSGDSLGVLKSVIQTGANDVYVIEFQHKEVLLPASPNVVKYIDTEKKIIEIDPIPGIFE